MKRLLPLALILAILIPSGCTEETPTQERGRALEFAKTSTEFSTFLQNYPDSEIFVQQIEQDETGMFERPIVLENAEQQCSKSFQEKNYWHVKAKYVKHEISTLIDKEIKKFECIMGEGTNLTPNQGDPNEDNSNGDVLTPPPFPDEGDDEPEPGNGKKIEVEPGLCSNNEYYTRFTIHGANLSQSKYISLSFESRDMLEKAIDEKGSSALLEISNLDCLEFLYIDNANFSDTTYLAGFKNLKFLKLYEVAATNLWPLQNLTTLETLEIVSNQAINIEPLKTMHSLKIVFLNQTSVLRKECQSLAAALPNAKVYCPEPQTFECTHDLDCEDGNPCTHDLCDRELGKCKNNIVDYCWSNDGCCPAGCYQSGAGNKSDNDCAADFCQLTNSDSQCPSGCLPETDWDCCIMENSCWIYQSGSYKCYNEGEINPLYELNVCNPGKNKIDWTKIPRPDLTITQIIFVPAEIVIGKEASATVYYKNMGDVSSGEVAIRTTFSHCDLKPSANFQNLAPGEEKWTEFKGECNWYANDPKLELRISEVSGIGEWDLSNNSKTVSIPLKPETYKQTYNEGEYISNFEGAGEYAMPGASIEVTAIMYAPYGGYQAMFTLQDDQNGNFVSLFAENDTVISKEFFDSKGNYALKDTVYVGYIGVDPATSEKYVEIRVWK